MSLFRSPDIFEEAEVMIYGEYKKVAYYCANFLWKPVGALIRFVWVIDGDARYVLMCSESPALFHPDYHHRFLSLENRSHVFCP
jgi:hypothetical protein